MKVQKVVHKGTHKSSRTWRTCKYTRHE